jgi:hypothetical protein
LLYNSLYGLGQIFQNNYHKSILPLKNTESIVSIGIAANTTHINLAILDIETSRGKYTNADKIICMAFKVTEADNNTIRVDHPYILEANISINQTSPLSKAEKEETNSLEKTKKDKADSQENTRDEKEDSQENTEKENEDSPKKTRDGKDGSPNEKTTNSTKKVGGHKSYTLPITEKNDTNKDPYSYDAINENIRLWIWDLLENPSKFNVTYIQPNTTLILQPPKRRGKRTP